MSSTGTSSSSSSTSVATTTTVVDYINIPLKQSEKSVKISINNLPSAHQVVSILKKERSSLSLWLKIAAEYYKQGRLDDFKSILTDSLDVDDGRDSKHDSRESKHDRIAILNALSSYYTQLGAVEKVKQKREDLFSRAVSHLTRADKIDHLDHLNWVGKAILLLCKGDTDHAFTNFKNVLDPSISGNPPIVPALLGNSCILFNKGNYDKALEDYQRVIQLNPNCPPTVRLGLGNCYFRLGRMERAKQAFERVLAMDPDNVEAMIGLALVLMNGGDVAQGMSLIAKAYQLAPTNSLVLNHLANHYFHKGEYQKVHALAAAALTNTDANQIKAESCYLIARVHHANEKWPEALQYYHQAVLNTPDFFLAQFGLGQTYIKNGMVEKAISCFESVLEKQPDSYETLQILGSLYRHSSQAKNIDKIKAVLTKATQINPNDYINWFELAQLLERTDAHAALDAYNKGIAILKKEGIDISAEIHNNVGVLSHKVGQYEEAERIYMQVIEDSGATIEDYKAINITTTYNLARLYESMNNFTRARELHIGILTEHPTYLDCYLRMSALCRAEGNDFEASEWSKQALLIDPNNAEAWSMFGCLQLSKEQWSFAQNKFEQILETNKHDPYASLALGNLYFQAKIHNPDKFEKYLSLAETYYTKTLKNNPTNIYAANGIGMVAFERGNITLATDIFVQLRESAVDVPSVSLNLAHIYMQKRLFDFAIRLYDGCLKKSNNAKEMELMYLYLAKAYFEAQRYPECKQTLKKALHISPANMALQYNFALAIEKCSQTVIQSTRKTLYEYSTVQKELDHARQVFERLATLKNPKTMIDTKKCIAHLSSVKELLKTVGDEVQTLEKNEIATAKKREEAAEESRRQAREKERVEAERKATALARLEEEERQAAEGKAKFEELMREREREKEGEENEEESSRSSRKKNKKRDHSDDEDERSSSKRERKKDRKKKKSKKDKKDRSERSEREESDGEMYQQEDQSESTTGAMDIDTANEVTNNQEYEDLFGSGEEN
ncbi:hypothetical protein SAMD00019534_080350 [Acytostelium subglobosum LB1]|uniref:hypothetical protein n=1 Tax=Acytostelium subglobosum LB1 TaxID=1410327 RepID=UPI000644BB22|nr:hypothetical protein SAMD00019534_080350 [Acytostelium subglobosum LB1]GAM24860.1 hypothetical protein SAMD00019534_080350 [Acytostelium subglobosum LB1]|eukprot:XP_012751949.1 hypothetical protein SAMD00019534_080350 [Acytostelium subglobosum LB1]